MTVEEARQIARDFDENKKFAKEDEFAFIEAMNFLIEELHDPSDMMWLGGYYYELKHFDLALKYYEMAAALDYDEAYECLGYIWYYGRTGEKDYKKAFEYFSKMMDKGHLQATYKVADMYKNGYYVEKNQKKYEEIIESLYPIVRKCDNLFDPVPEVYTRLAKIRSEQGDIEEAVNLYFAAKDFLAQRIRYNAFFGNLNIMKWLIDDLYKLIEFDPYDFDLYDCYYLLNSPNKITFVYDGKIQSLESEKDGDECAVCFNSKWYHGRDEFFKEACIGDEKLTSIYRKLRDFKVE